MQDDTILYVIGGLGLLWLVTQLSPAAQSAQQEALAQAANLQSQAIQTGANVQNVNTVSNALQSIASDFS